MVSSRVSPALFAVLLASGTAAAEPPRIQFVNGDVSVLRADGTRAPVRKGDALNPGDRLLTGAGGMAQVRAEGEGVVAVRPRSEIEFKPEGPGLGVVLNQGQVRTVTDIGGPTLGTLRVVTPDTVLAVEGGDLETGVLAPGDGGNTFNMARSGAVTVNPEQPAAVALEPGRAFRTEGSRPVAVAALPDVMTRPPLPLGPPQTDTAGVPNPALTPTLPVPSLKADLPLPVFAAASPVLKPGDFTSLNGAKVAVPQVRVEAAGVQIAGASTAVNDLLSGQRILQAGMVGQDKTLTPSADASLPASLPPAVFSPTTVQLNNQTLVGLAPPGNTTFIAGNTPVTQIVLVPTITSAATTPAVVTPTPGLIPTPTVTSASFVAPTVTPTITSTLVNTSTLSTGNVLVPTSPVLTGGFTFGGLLRR